MQDVFRAIGRLEPEQRHGADHRRERAPARSSSRARCTSTARARSGPFVAINTAAIPKDLLESRAVRPRARRLHRRADDAARPLRAGRRRHAVPRRDRRHAVRPADAPAARAVATASSTASAATTPLKSNVRVIAATHQNLEERVKPGRVPRGPVPPPERDPPAPAAAARAARGHPAAGAPLPAEERARARRRGQAPHRRRARAADRSSTSRATCASSRTSATG